MRGGKREGAGRKPSPETRRVRWPVRWTSDEMAEIEVAATEAGQTPTDFIRDAALNRARAN